MKRYPVYMIILIFFLFTFYTIIPCEAGAPLPVATPIVKSPLPVSPPIVTSPEPVSPTDEECPQGICWDPDKDWCGPSRFKPVGWVIPDSYWGLIGFKKACYNHDVCYSSGNTKEVCDKRIRDEIRDACIEYTPGTNKVEQISCSAIAGGYYSGVTSIFGEIAYWQAQQEYWESESRALRTKRSMQDVSSSAGSRNTPKPSGIGSWIDSLEGRQNAQKEYGSGTGKTTIEVDLEATYDTRFPNEGIEKKFSLGISKDYENALLYYGEDHHNSRFGYVKGEALAGVEIEKGGTWAVGAGLKGEVALFKRHDEVGDELNVSNDLDVGALKGEITPLEFKKSDEFTGLRAGAGVELIAVEDTLTGSLDITPKVVYDHLVKPVGSLFEQKLGDAPEWLDHGLVLSGSVGGGYGAAANAEAHIGKTEKGYGLGAEATAGAGWFGKLGFNVSVI